MKENFNQFSPIKILAILFIWALVLSGCKLPTATPTTAPEYPQPFETLLPPYSAPQLAADIPVTQQYQLTVDNVNWYHYTNRSGTGDRCSAPAISPIVIDLPENGIVTNVRYYAIVDYWDGAWASNHEIFLENSTGMSFQIWEYGMGNSSGEDGQLDDDPENDTDIHLDSEARQTAMFNNQLINGEWRLIARNCGLAGQGDIRWFQLTIDYVSGPQLEVKPTSLSYVMDVGTTAQAEPEQFVSVQSVGAPTRVVVMTVQQGDIQAYDAIPGVTDVKLRETGFTATVTNAGLQALLDDPNVLNIVPDIWVSVDLNQSRPMINAEQTWALGYTGEGVSVAVIDTGADPDHPDLEDDILAGRCWGTCTNGWVDGNGHGSAVAGIITSEGINNIAPYGVAPDAGIVALKCLDDTGSGWLSDCESAVRWATAHAQEYNIKVINMSLGGGGQYEYNCNNLMPTFAQAITLAKQAGVAVFVASGNEYSTTGVSVPACFSDSISVGAVFDAGIGDVDYCQDPISARDKVICYSNSGSNLDVLAPSGNIRTTNHLGGVYAGFAGTSAAAPHAAAVAALMFQANPYLTVDQLEQRMEVSGKPIVDYRTGKVFPRIDALAAVTQTGVRLTNVGSDTLIVSNISHTACWYNPVVTLPLEIDPLDSAFIPIELVPCVTGGHYTDTLTITSNGGNASISVELHASGDLPNPPTATPVTPTSVVPTATATNTPVPSATNTPQPGATSTPYPMPSPQPTPIHPRLDSIILQWADGITETYKVILTEIFLPYVTR